MILECIVTTIGSDGELNVAPMGPIIDENDLELDRFVLRPFQTATTFQNLSERKVGVLHITDNVELLARAAVSEWESPPEVEPAVSVSGSVIMAANRWYEFEAESIDASTERSTIQCHTTHRGRRSDFVGLNRAKYAVVEAAILMTRLDFLPLAEIEQQMQKLDTIVGKTAGPVEYRAFKLLQNHLVAHSQALANHDG